MQAEQHPAKPPQSKRRDYAVLWMSSSRTGT
jgi:hypothetical protein